MKLIVLAQTGKTQNIFSKWYPYKNFGFLFFSFCFCMNPIWYPYTSGSLRRPHPAYPIGSFAHTFSTLRKRPLLSEITYGILTQAGPKNLPKKVEKNSFRLFFGPPRVRRTYYFFAK